jgi:hypothetical protein
MGSTKVGIGASEPGGCVCIGTLKMGGSCDFVGSGIGEVSILDGGKDCSRDGESESLDFELLGALETDGLGLDGSPFYVVQLLALLKVVVNKVCTT